MQESTKSLGRTQVRSAQVEEGKRGEECLGSGGFRNGEKRVVGLISRLCVHFFLGCASRGSPISFPRSFKPVEMKLLSFRQL